MSNIKVTIKGTNAGERPSMALEVPLDGGTEYLIEDLFNVLNAWLDKEQSAAGE